MCHVLTRFLHSTSPEMCFFFFSSRRRHTRCLSDWSSDVCSSDLLASGSAERRTDIACDVTKPADVDRAVARVEHELGVPDVLVNNAGIFFIKPLAETTHADFTATLTTNLTAAFLCAHAVVPKMVARGSGHLVTIGSISDYIGFSGSTAYAASKFGLRGMHEVIRQETAKSGVRN